MNFGKIIRWIWHAFFYILSPPSLRRYALTCREAVTELNSSNQKSRRLNLHLTLCQGCSNYLRYSEWLRGVLPKKMYSNSKDLNQKIFDRLK